MEAMKRLAGGISLLRPNSRLREATGSIGLAYKMAEAVAEGMVEIGMEQGRVCGRGARVPHRGAALLLCGAMLLIGSPVHADRIDNSIAVFSALDKVTARTSKFEVPLNSTVQFGALKVTPRACYSRPPEEQPKTTSFVEVDEIQLDGDERRIFTGWMFAESPGLNAVEHPVFDVWLTDCQKPRGSVAQRSSESAAPEAGGEAPSEEDFFQPRRRVRR